MRLSIFCKVYVLSFNIRLNFTFTSSHYKVIIIWKCEISHDNLNFSSKFLVIFIRKIIIYFNFDVCFWGSIHYCFFYCVSNLVNFIYFVVSMTIHTYNVRKIACYSKYLWNSFFTLRIFQIRMRLSIFCKVYVLSFNIRLNFTFTSSHYKVIIIWKCEISHENLNFSHNETKMQQCCTEMEFF